MYNFAECAEVRRFVDGEGIHMSPAYGDEALGLASRGEESLAMDVMESLRPPGIEKELRNVYRRVHPYACKSLGG